MWWLRNYLLLTNFSDIHTDVLFVGVRNGEEPQSRC